MLQETNHNEKRNPVVVLDEDAVVVPVANLITSSVCNAKIAILEDNDETTTTNNSYYSLSVRIFMTD